ncbi:VWA domain-containing protein [Wenzhouxiangella sp. C33]|uniref:VWA domain-containing protein n=2 Tax=Wenzhouxiangella limi TaxID=2707351 RepID=A0A845V6D0_9GAMM|nr:VWA domain-containing protein [Wenzhouxiangella limi]
MIGLAAVLTAVGCSAPETDRQAGNDTFAPAQPEVLHPPTEPEVAVALEQIAVSPRIAVSDAAHASRVLGQPTHPGNRPQNQNRERYRHFDDNPVRRAAEDPVSTFSIDVDTGSYANVRRMLQSGRLPSADAVRVEEMINYFGYDYPRPDPRQAPFSVSVEQTATPWNARTRLVQIGIRGHAPAPEDIPPANLVFLVDVSGSMNGPDRLPLVVNGLKLLARQLGANDRIALVVYAARTGVVLESTAGDQTATIMAALDQLQAGGSTNGGDGLRMAYGQARQGFIKGGINRVILATDGDFNVGTVDQEALLDLIRRQRESGISLTTLGVGGGNYNDYLMDQLAAAGDGNSAYIDTLSEARKVLVEERHSTLMTIASDVKIQVEFNPAVVAEYRLIGYENRQLEREDFNNDAVDAGDIGAGHTVTALYEVALTGSGGERIDPLRYGEQASQSDSAHGDELAFVRLRYKTPGESVSQLLETPVRSTDKPAASDNLAFAAAVAAFGQHLRGGEHLEQFTLADIHALASQARGDDTDGYRGEFLQLIRLAESLSLARR